MSQKKEEIIDEKNSRNIKNSLTINPIIYSFFFPLFMENQIDGCKPHLPFRFLSLN